MRRKGDNTQEGRATEYWMPFSGLVSGMMLVLIVVFVIGFLYFRIQGSGIQSGDTASAGDDTAISQSDSSGNANSTGNEGNEGSESDNTGNTASGSGSDSDAVIKDLQNKLKVMEEGFGARQKAFDKYASIRKGLAALIKEKLAAAGLAADVDAETGNVSMGDAVLFNVNNTSLSPSGQQYLKRFMLVYLEAVAGSEYSSYLSQIVIEGHADDGGTYLYNLDLSQKRAHSVVAFIIGNKLDKLGDGTVVQKFFAISGRSSSKPVIVNGKTDRNKSRRVEFVYVLKENLLQQLAEEGLNKGSN